MVAPPKQIDALNDAVGALVDRAIDRVLLTGERVRSPAEGKSMLRKREDTEALADNVQRVVVLATPVVRGLVRSVRFTRVPWVLVASTTVSIGLAVRNGVRELQVLAALIAYRLEQTSGEPADPALVKWLAVELYLEPRRSPDLVGSRRLRLGKLTRRWLMRGAFGRDTEKQARRALDSAGKLDVDAALAAWKARRAHRELVAVSADTAVQR